MAVHVPIPAAGIVPDFVPLPLTLSLYKLVTTFLALKHLSPMPERTFFFLWCKENVLQPWSVRLCFTSIYSYLLALACMQALVQHFFQLVINGPKSFMCHVKENNHTQNQQFSSYWSKVIAITHNNSYAGGNSLSSGYLSCLAMRAPELYTASKNNLFKRFLVYICLFICHLNR